MTFDVQRLRRVVRVSTEQLRNFSVIAEALRGRALRVMEINAYNAYLEGPKTLESDAQFSIGLRGSFIHGTSGPTIESRFRETEHYEFLVSVRGEVTVCGAVGDRV